MKLNEVLRVKKLYAREVKEYWNIDIGLGHAKKVMNIAREGGKKKRKKKKTLCENILRKIIALESFQVQLLINNQQNIARK